jgi:hypothetical protein
VASSATTGKKLTFNNMEGTPLPLPISIDVAPGEDLELRLEMRMHGGGMEGPHHFRLPVQVEGESQPLVLHVQGTFR